MHAALHHTEYGATVSCSIRLMLWSGATVVNRGAFFSDGWFTSVKLAVAMEKLLPGYSLTGIIKNNSSGFPIAFLRNYCASKSGRIRKAGFNAYMTSTLPNGTKMLAIGHNTEEGATKFLLTTAGDGKLGKDYVQSFISGDGERGSKGVDRPSQFVTYYRRNGVIDSFNRQHNHELRLFETWPVKQFWKKNFVKHEGIVFTEMYCMMRQNGYLESFTGGGGEVESLLQFLDRFIGVTLKEKYKSPIINLAPAKKTAAGRPITRPTAKRGRGRGVDADGAHEHGGFKRPKKGSSTFTQGRGACRVCVKFDRRMQDKQKGFPQTSNYCEYCQAFVHGRGAGVKYNECWQHHIDNKCEGMYRAGEL